MSKNTYPIEQLYLGSIENRKTIAFYNSGIYYDVFGTNISEEDFNENFKMIDCFEDLLKSNGLDLLVTDINGNPKKYLNSQEIGFLFKILGRKLSLSQETLQKYYFISSNVVNIVSDLLGLNVRINPNTPFKFDEKIKIEEILVSAKKLKLFKKYLLDYISSSLIATPNVSLSYGENERDYRISKSLNKAKIPQTNRIKQNKFSLSVDSSGRIMVNDIDIRQYPKERGFQKTIKF